MKKIIKTALKYIVVYVILITLFVALLALSSIFPSSWIKENVAESTEYLISEADSEESNYWYVPIVYKGIKVIFDNYSDALMINTAYSIDNNEPLYSAFVARKNYIPGKTDIIIEEGPGELGFASKFTYRDQVQELNATVNGEVLESFEYARYWHGYLAVIRPLLILFNINSIRILFIILFIILGIILFYLLCKKINLITAIIFLIGLFYVEYLYIGLSIQGSFVFFIMMIASIIILKRYDKIKSFPLLFFITGMITNFFDLLSAPALTLGIPMLIYFALKNKEQELSIKEYILKIASLSISWVIGYALTWVAKWTLLDLIYQKNIFNVALQQVFYRAGGEETVSFLEVLISNYEYVMGGIMISLLAIYIYTIAKGLSNYKLKLKLTKRILPFFIIALIPIVWYFVVQNHSYHHAFFTYRNLALTLIGIPLGILTTLTFNKKV